MSDAESTSAASYLVGIDLGTSNCAAAFIDTEDQARAVRTLEVPQVVAPSEVASRETLPSCRYEAAPGEFSPGALRLPWSEDDPAWCVGAAARSLGDAAPERLVASAKSWLCHGGVDRTAPLLPWRAAADVPRCSPVDASAAYLAHFRAAWNHAHPRHPLEDQDVVVTLPASFDEAARELTIRAARAAGLPRIVLLEEPQAAFYAWLHHHGDGWEQQVGPGDAVLVCDIGGGTTDFTLIRVRRGAGDRLQFHRVAVGPHLILGGDNLDLALAQHLESQFGDAKLDPHEWSVLLHGCRKLKETMLAADAPESQSLSLPGAGSKLIGGARVAEAEREAVRRLLLDGFLPSAALDARPDRRRSGFQELGLPYAADPAITRHLAEFLALHADAGLREEDGEPSPLCDVVLFNGGFFASPLLRERVVEVLTGWRQEAGRSEPLRVLENDRLDLAVAQGAAYYGLVRRGEGSAISASLARSYYVGVQGAADAAQAVCLAPGETEPGQTIDLDEPRFLLTLRRPIELPLFVSSTRLADPAGAVVDVDPEQMTSLPPIRTVIDGGRKEAGDEQVEVLLSAGLTELGSLEVSCRAAADRRRWKLSFDVRSTVQTDRAAHRADAEAEGFVEQAAADSAFQVLESVFGAAGESAAGVVKRLEGCLDAPRGRWPSSLLRELWERLFELEAGRRHGADHEARWLSLVGYCLRPGYGFALDDWRVDQTWRLLSTRPLLHATPNVRVERLILWRRLAGGMTAGQQQALAEPLLAGAAAAIGRKGKSGGTNRHEAAESLRLLGALERLAPDAKIRLGDELVRRVRRETQHDLRDAAYWTIGRLGARRLLYGPLNAAVPPETAAAWATAVMDHPGAVGLRPLTVMQLARACDDRFLDVDDKLRSAVGDWLSREAAPEHYIRLVRQNDALDAEERSAVFGDALPLGLQLAV